VDLFDPCCWATISDSDAGDLEIEGIIQRPPSPAPPVKLENRDPADLTPDEARERIRRWRAREAANNAQQVVNRLKRERERERSATLGQGNVNEEDNTDGDDDLTITAEWDRRKSQRWRFRGDRPHGRLNFMDNTEGLFAMGVSISYGEGLERMVFKHFSFDVARNVFHCSTIERLV
jgi:hypothetical protein